ncbi:MAG: tetratricopeptide repeat protein [Rubripirellula sp.]
MVRSLFLASVLLCGSTFVMAQDAGKDVSLSSLRVQALKALQKGDNAAAILSADAMTRLHPDDQRAMRLSADIYLRTGKIDWAVRLFDRYVKERPADLPELWQRGIALYFAGEFKRAAKQFEEHRKVNPNDVENAAWHFLCIAKADSFEAATKALLPAPNDRRPPMDEVLKMLKSGDTDTVNKRVDSIAEDSAARGDAEFYRDFYLGLYADAKGEQKKATKLLERSANDAPHHYMGDIARVYAKHLAEK